MTDLIASGFAVRPGAIDGSLTAPRVLSGQEANWEYLLPTPTIGAIDGYDMMSRVMATMERMAEASLEETQNRIEVNQQKLDKSMEDYLEKMAQAAREAAKERSKGFFSKICDAVVDTCASVIGTVADFAVDSVEAQFEIARDVVRGIDNPGNALKNALLEQAAELTSNGDRANSVREFTQGTLRFGVDLAVCSHQLALECARCVAEGKSVDMAVVKELLDELWNSFSENILTNKGFQDVMEVVAVAAAVGASVLSGGTLGAVAVALIIAMQIDKNTGALDKALGDDVAPWMRLAMCVAVAACTGAVDGSSAQAAKTVQGVTTMVSGVSTVEQARLTYLHAAEQRGEALTQAELQQSLDTIQRLREVAGQLIDELQEKTETKTTLQETCRDVVNLSDRCFSAALLQA